VLSLLALATLGGLTKNRNDLTLSSVAVSGVISNKHCQCARAFTQTFNKPTSDNYLSSTKNLVIRALKTLLLITLNFNLYYIAYKTIKRMIIQVQTVKTEGNVCVGQIWSLSSHYLSYARIIFPAGFARHGVLNKNPTVWLDGWPPKISL